jgi:hypothetical protein
MLQPAAEAPLLPMFTLMPLGFLGGCQTNLKLGIQIAAGFESVVFYLWWPPINRNVDWTNIYYN